MRPLELTTSGVIRALVSIDNAVKGRAEELAGRLKRLGIETRVEREGEADYVVVSSGEGLFAREFGGLDRQAEGPIEAAIESMKIGSAE